MSRSLERVKRALQAAGLACDPVEMSAETRTADQAAAAAGCQVNQIVKSILLQGGESGQLFLFLTAGGHQVDVARAGALAGEPLARAGVDTVRAMTGFAIGGVAPLGHLSPLPTWMDATLLGFAQVWAAAGTPRHIFPSDPDDLRRATKATVADFTA